MLKKALIFFPIFIILLIFSRNCFAQESICYGTSERGLLDHGVQLPSSGNNWTSYGLLPENLGRTYVHSVVKDVVIKAYEIVLKEYPDKVFKFGETGYQSGGVFKPHKTHQNGSSVDFMVPVMLYGKSVHLPTTAFNKYGYGIEFDSKGQFGKYKIDYEAIAAHMVALDKAAKMHKITLRRIIFDPQLIPYLYKTNLGTYLKKNIVIPKTKSWVRHDEHYHVDFNLNCKPLSTKHSANNTSKDEN